MTFDGERIAGFWVWKTRGRHVEALFAGRGPGLEWEESLKHLLPEGVEPAWLKQIHSAEVLSANPGPNGAGDALTTKRSRLALAVVTADCVPVLMASKQRIAAVHAGWRGLAGPILPKVVHRFEQDPEAAEVTAWIGPAIGACCYEVGPEVAQEVSAESSTEIVREGPRGRPHIDLAAAARIQLERCGVTRVRTADICTRCDTRLWSYRRDRDDAGRNISAIWVT